MSPLSLSKKLKPAKRAWKSFNNKVKTQLQNLQINVESIKSTTHRFVKFLSVNLFLPFRKRFLTKATYHHNNNNNNNHQYYKHFHQYQTPSPKSFAAAYSDKERKTRGKEVCVEENINIEPLDSLEDAWRNVVASSPHLRVDQRADDFIFKFRQEIKLEKERSALEFQERLRRSA